MTDPRGRGAPPSSHTLKCPSCGAPNLYNGQGKMQACSYCGAEIAVPPQMWPPPVAPTFTPIPQAKPWLGLLGCAMMIVMALLVIIATIVLSNLSQ